MNKQAIKQLSEQILIEAFLKKNDLAAYVPVAEPFDFELLDAFNKFKKFIGWIGDTFYVTIKDRLTIPEGEYKILKIIPKKKDAQINLQKVDNKFFKKKYKVKIRDFLRRKHLW